MHGCGQWAPTVSRNPPRAWRPPALRTAGTSTGKQGEVLGGTAIEGARGKEPVQKAVPAGKGSPPPAPAGSERIIGTKRLYADGKFNKEDGRAVFHETQWRGLQAAGKEEEKEKFPFLINNGRTNHVWQSAYLDQQNELVMDRWPYPFIEMNPD